MVADRPVAPTSFVSSRVRIVRAARWSALLLGVLAATACGPSVEQARQIATTLRPATFTAPPRSARDVIARLQAPTTGRETDRWRALAEQEPPAGASQAALAQFHLRRARAAARAGRADRYLLDLRRAHEHLDNARGITRVDAREILRELQEAEAQVGRYTAATDALARLQRLQGTSAVNNVRLADLLLSLGDLPGAFEAASRARAQMAKSEMTGDRSAPSTAAVAEALLAGAQGRWAEAEPFWRRALALVSLTFSVQAHRSAELGASEDVGRARLRSSLIEALRRQGRALEAEVQAREALQEMLDTLGPSTLEAVDTVNELALAVLDQGRAADADALAMAALARLDALRAPADAPLRGTTRLIRVRASLVRGDRAAAGRELAALRGALGDNRTLFERALAIDPDVALVLVRTGQIDEALSLASAGHRALATSFGPTHPETLRMQSAQALALAAGGRAAEALAAFREALPHLLAHGAEPVGLVPTGQGTDWRLPIVIEGYVDLLATSAGAAAARAAGLDPAAEAFRMADLARAGGAQRALTANAARAASRTPELADLVRREQDAQAQILALLGQLGDTALAAPGPAGAAAGTTESRRAGRASELKRQIATLTTARHAMRSEIERRFPDYATLVAPRPTSLDEARDALRPGEALVAFLSGEARTWAWVVPREGPVAFIAAPIGRDRLLGLVETIRRGTDLGSVVTVDDVPAFDVAAAHELYRRLLEPIAPAWTPARTLVVVPHGPLARIPLSLLVTAPAPARVAPGPRFAEYRGIDWLIRTHAVTTVPSIGSLVAVRRLPPASGPRLAFVGFGDPQFSPTAPAPGLAPREAISARRLGVRRPAPSAPGDLKTQLARLAPLPDTADELRSIAASLEASAEHDVILGPAATEGRVKSMDLSRHRVIAFATHALRSEDLDGLDEPALALSLAPGEPDDGLLTLGELLALKLDADWMVLSACNTAAGATEEAEVMSGLGRAAFYAGARAVLLSHWAVESAAARLLTTELFRRQRQSPGLSRAEALRQSMLALIDGPGATDARSGAPLYSRAHPAFWAPFVVVGDGS